MTVHYAQSYVDRLFEAKDLPALYDLISVVGKGRALPQEFSVFCWLWEWRGSRRSGIWQYYEGIAPAEFDKISQAFDRFGLSDLAERYRYGMKVWKDEGNSAMLTKWMYDHNEEIEDAAFKLISGHRECLHEG